MYPSKLYHARIFLHNELSSFYIHILIKNKLEEFMMGIFKSQVEKDAEKQAKMEKWLNERGLSGISKDNYQQVSRIRTFLFGTGLLGLFSSTSDATKNSMYLLQAIAEQNWLLIKQQDKLAKQNDEIIEILKKRSEK